LHGEGVAGGAVYFDHGIGDVATSVTLTVEGQAGGQGFSGVIAVDTVGIYDVVAEFEGQSSVVRLGLCRNVIPFQ
jgi:hypothetical protein